MKKRARWTAFFSLFFLVFVVLGAHHVRKKQKERKEKKQTSAYLPRTWSSLSQVPHLVMLLEGFGIESVLDLPSRDIDALKAHNLPIKHYMGGAFDRDEATKLQARFGGATRSFYPLDIRLDPLPKVDLIICWDHLSPLPPIEVESALLQCKKSGSKFLMLSHYPAVEVNPEGESLIARPINWKKAPYHLPEPIIALLQKEEGEYLALWNIKDIK